MGVIVCPQCGLSNSEFNPRCQSCNAALPQSSTGHSQGPGTPASGSSDGSAGESLVGRRIARFRLLELLGRGGMGEVYRAYDERFERPVALKIIRPDKSQHDELRRRFHREARAAAALDHPAIVHVYDVLELEEGDCIVMELVEGHTLSELLGKGSLDLVRIVALAREVAEGLAEAHSHGIVHRDLKAENVMITPAGHPRILDFGLAKRFARGDREGSQPDGSLDYSLTVDGGVVGTSHAMSPEQAQGFKVDHRSDLFSLGSLLYEATTGRSPFRRGNLAVTLAQLCIHRQPPARELNPEVPEALSSLIDHLLEKQPDDRPQSAGEVAAALEDILIELAER